MININQALKDHELWLSSNGERGKHANLIDADLTGSDLRNANLFSADLIYADLRNADLRNANLSDADLTDADLTGADLTNANLIDADLTGADLTNANLSRVKLWNCVGNGKEIKSLLKGGYTIVYTCYRIQIGCKNYSPPEWASFTDDEIDQMSPRALEWWKEHKDFVLNLTKEIIQHG